MIRSEVTTLALPTFRVSAMPVVVMGGPTPTRHCGMAFASLVERCGSISTKWVPSNTSNAWQANAPGIGGKNGSFMTKNLSQYKLSRREVARHRCLDCGVNVIKLGDYCMLHDRIWNGQFGLGVG
jgi:hypothetical protein